MLLDSDAAGEKEKNRYLTKFGSMLDNLVITYADVDPTWENHGLEKIIAEQDRIKIQNACFPGTSYKKETFHLAIQELISKKTKISITDKTRKGVEKVIAFAQEIL